MKRIMMILMTIVLTVFNLTGCHQGQVILDPDDPVTLSFWHVYNSQEGSPLNETVREFNNTIGKEKGIYIQVTSVSDSKSIDAALQAAYEGKPWVGDLPDLFTAYPRIVDILGEDILLDWGRYYSKEELEGFVPEFLADGIMNDHLYMLPIARSMEILTLNQTHFDRFGQQCGVSVEDLKTFEDLFSVSNQYYDWSNGKAMIQLNDFYHYFVAGMESYGTHLIRQGEVNYEDETFRKLYVPMAEAAVYGGLCIGKGYVSDRWKTGEIISSINSSSQVAYIRNYVTYNDNSKEQVKVKTLPYPLYKDGDPVVIQNGAGLFAINSSDPRKNKAAMMFAKWLIDEHYNIPFVMKSGYLPVMKESYREIEPYLEDNEDKKMKDLYNTVYGCQKSYSYISLPQYPKAMDVQMKFEQDVRNVLNSYHERYRKEKEYSNDPQSLLHQLVDESYEELKRKQ